LACALLPTLLFAEAAFAQQGVSFEEWLAALQTEARARGISEATLDAAFAGVEPVARIIELDRTQPEGRLTAAQYLERAVPQARISAARERLAVHRDLLEAVARRYRVQPRFIVALWGIETDFGRNTGGFGVIEALATLAYDGRRSAFFRSELLDALRVIDQGHVGAQAMSGSWAGAMGQSQFMPSSFLAYAVDYDGDGRRDIWTSLADVFASIANYLALAGWKDDQTWGRPVRLPAALDGELVGLEVVKPIGAWQALGVRNQDGGDLPVRQLPGSIVRPDGPGSQAYLVYDNFRTTLKWNRSAYFALAVGRLADAMIGH
jgi:membrane-bound lytic murein transglycosylase B